MDDLEKALRHVFRKIAVPFSPHKSQNVREAELTDILNRCTDTYRGSMTNMSDSASFNLPGNLVGQTDSTPSTSTTIPSSASLAGASSSSRAAPRRRPRTAARRPRPPR
ncbi:unnamed protein product [Prorocentrum cordatum]|uniref:Uncharacterized protein n=1 Tax=Prorocentrum cordatum TaxID=2364126 RepID=A0ABN9X7T0_9DINO|nr:unnamed protein product [Polarella glacialis]